MKKLKTIHIIIFVVAAIILGIIYLSALNLNGSLKTTSHVDENNSSTSEQSTQDYKKDRIAIIVFLKDNFVEKERLELSDYLSKIDSVLNVKYISKEDALKIYRERNKDEPLLLENVTVDFLPASLDVYMSDWTNRKEIKSQIESWEIVERVIAPEEIH